MRYVMVADRPGHWDKMPGGWTSVATFMLVPPMAADRLQDDTAATLLLFTRRPRAPLKAWTGRVTHIDYAHGRSTVRFRVLVDEVIRFPAVYAHLANGWYLDEPGAIPISGALG